eukprot:2378-Heterococcus_DN1.PRE.5
MQSSSTVQLLVVAMMATAAAGFIRLAERLRDHESCICERECACSTLATATCALQSAELETNQLSWCCAASGLQATSCSWTTKHASVPMTSGWCRCFLCPSHKALAAANSAHVLLQAAMCPICYQRQLTRAHYLYALSCRQQAEVVLVDLACTCQTAVAAAATIAAAATAAAVTTADHK